MQSNGRVNYSRVNDSANNGQVNNSRLNTSHLHETKKPFTQPGNRQPATGSQDPAVRIRQLAVVNSRAVVNG